MKIRHNFGIVLTLTLLILFIGCTLSVCAAGISIDGVPAISADEGNYVFDVAVADVDSSISANAVVATYGADGRMLNMRRSALKSDGTARVYVPLTGEETSYRVMVLDATNELKPLCADYEGSITAENYKPLKTVSDDIRSVYKDEDGLLIDYYENPVVSSKVLQLKLDNNFELYFNGSSNNYFGSGASNTDVLEDALVADDILLEFYDYDGDGIYNVVKAKKYNYGIIDSVDAASGSITIDGYEYRFGSDGIEISFKDASGNVLSCNDFSKDELVAYMMDDIYAGFSTTETLCVVKNNHTVTGVVVESYVSNDLEYAVVNDTEYTLSEGLDIYVGDEGTFYIGMTGKIVYFDSSYEPNYAYILETAKVDNSFSADTWQVKLLTKDGVAVYDMTENASEELSWLFEDKSVTWDGMEITEDRLVDFGLNSKGEIKTFSVADFLKDIDASKYNASTGMIDGYYIDEDVRIFVLNEDVADEVWATDISYLCDGAEYAGAIYLDEDGDSEVLLISEVGYDVSENSDLAVVSSVKWTMDSEGNDVIKVEYYEAEEKKTAIMNEDTYIISEDYVYAEDLKTGSVLVIFEEVDGIIRQALHVGSVEDRVFSPDAVVERYSGDIVFKYGYISNDARISNSRGEMLIVNDGTDELYYAITSDTHKYTYDDTISIARIHSGDFLATLNTYYLDSENETSTPVVMLCTDEVVRDICSFNTPVNIADITPSDNVRPVGTGTTTYMGESVTMNTLDIVNAEENTKILVYYNDPFDHCAEKVTRLSVDSDAKLHINGTETDYLADSHYTVAEMMKVVGEDASITLKDTNADRRYDVIDAEIYYYGFVEEVNVEDAIIILDGIEISLDYESADIEIVDSQGNTLTADELCEDDFVALISDNLSSPWNYNNYLKVIKLTNATEGKVVSLWQSEDYTYLEIDGKNYIDIMRQFSVGDEGRFYTDVNGNAIYVFENTQKPNYAYILEAALSDSAFTADKYQLKMLTKDGVAIYDTTEDVSEELDYMFGGNCPQWDYPEISEKRFVTFKTDSGGVIKTLEFASSYNMESIDCAEYNASTGMLDGNYLGDDTYVFVLNEYHADEVWATDTSYLYDGAEYGGALYIDDSGEVGVLLITDVGYSVNEKSNLAVVSSVKYTKDNEDNDVVKIEYFEKEEQKTAIMNEDTYIISEDYVDVTELKTGSVLVIFEEVNGIIRNALHVGSVEDRIFSPDAVVERYSGDIVFKYGYISNDARISNSRGETLYVSDGDSEEAYVIGNNTFKYTYDDSISICHIDAGDFLSTDNTYYLDEENGTSTPVLLLCVEGFVRDILSFNTPVNISDMTPSNNMSLIGKGTTEYNSSKVDMNTYDIINSNEKSNILVYYNDSFNHAVDKVSKIAIDTDAVLYLNRGTIDYLSAKDFSVYNFTDILYSEGSSDWELTFEDTDGDKKYDVIMADHYVYGLVEYADINKSYLGFEGRRIELDFENADIEIVDDKGNVLNLDDLESDDYVAILTDDINNPRNYSEFFKLIKLTECMEGKVSASRSYEYDYIEINSNSYIVNEYCMPLYVGDTGKFYANLRGNIINYFEGKETPVGYILQSALSDSAFSADVWQLKLLTEEGVALYTLTEDASYAYMDYYGDKAFELEEPAEEYRLITYVLDSTGKIKSFEPVSEAYEVEGEYRASLNMIDGKCLEDDAKVFVVTSYDPEGNYVTDLSGLTDESTYRGFVYSDDNGEYWVLVVTEKELSFGEEYGFCIVTKMAVTLEDDGKEVTKVNYVRDGDIEEVAIFTDNSVAKTDSDIFSMDVGSVFAYVPAYDGTVDCYAVIAEPDYFNYNEGFVLGDITHGLGEDVEIVCGYIANDRRGTVSSGEIVTVADDNIEYSVLVGADTNKYTLNDSGRTIKLVTGDFMAGDAYYFDPYLMEATPVVARISSDVVTDIYTKSRRISLEQ